MRPELARYLDALTTAERAIARLEAAGDVAARLRAVVELRQAVDLAGDAERALPELTRAEAPIAAAAARRMFAAADAIRRALDALPGERARWQTKTN
jgi:hypothetical protein